jgi:hypothetical protein
LPLLGIISFSRLLGFQLSAAVYHVIHRGGVRQPTFVDDRDFQVCLGEEGSFVLQSSEAGLSILAIPEKATSGAGSVSRAACEYLHREFCGIRPGFFHDWLVNESFCSASRLFLRSN